MDELYPPEKFSCTENLKLQEYFSKFGNLLVSKELSKSGHSAEYTNTTFQEIDMQMRKDISINLLDNVPEDDYEAKVNLSDDLSVLQTTKIRKEKSAELFPKERFPQTDSYSNNEESLIDITNQNYAEEFAVSIRIYHPFEFNVNNSKPNSYHNIKFSHEIVLLGSNTLAEFRDKILCFNDCEIFTEVENPFVPLLRRPDAKYEYPSGFIFIDNVFYNDRRDPRSIDYSEVILAWAKKKRIAPLSVAEMETTKINQLTPRFGYPYMYLHQGKCEHIIVFTDAWLVTNHNLKISDYPRYEGVHRFYSRRCILCNLLNAQWMILNSERLPHVRSFLCDECLFSYLYKDGEKVGSFKVYQFYDKNRVL